MTRNWGTSVAAVAVVTIGLLGAAVGTAEAGSDGQQINYYSHDATGQCTQGANQQGRTATTCTTFTTAGSNANQGYFWVGVVTITWKRPNGSTVSSTCNIPKSYNGDFYTCHEPK